MGDLNVIAKLDNDLRERDEAIGRWVEDYADLSKRHETAKAALAEARQENERLRERLEHPEYGARLLAAVEAEPSLLDKWQDEKLRAEQAEARIEQLEAVNAELFDCLRRLWIHDDLCTALPASTENCTCSLVAIKDRALLGSDEAPGEEQR